DQNTRIPGLSPELNAIVCKAIEPNPERRYQSAQALAADIRHYLAGEPVDARPPQALTALWRFSNRHPVARARRGPAALLLRGWGMVAGILAMRLAERTRAAEAAECTAARINAVLMDALTSPRPARTGPDASASTLLESIARRADDVLLDAPAVRAPIHACL